jgi:hypothetical protein
MNNWTKGKCGGDGGGPCPAWEGGNTINSSRSSWGWEWMSGQPGLAWAAKGLERAMLEIEV